MSAGRIAVFVLLAGGVAALVISRMDAPPEPLVVLISIDTTRPDRLGPYGGLPGTSPNIDALAKDSVVFDQVLATSPWTLPSHMTMLTGLDPVAHGVRRNGDVLSGRVTTLPEALKKAGYRTGAFTGGGFVGAQFGFGAGFEVYRETNEPDGGPSGFARILPEALEWVNRARHEKSFVFLHTFDVHAPYDSCDPDTLQEFRTRPVTDGPNDYLLYKLSFLYQLNRMKVTNYTRFGELFNDYDAGVHMADDGVGRLIADLKESGRYDDALIIVTSDHGESFADHGLHIGHGIGLTDDELHVPLIIHFPKHEFAGRRIGTLVDLTDLAPTVLDVLHLPAPPEMKGESLAQLAAGAPRHRQFVMGVSQNAETAFLVREGFKFISSPSLLPMDVAKRHLGPFNPPGADPGTDYILGPKDVPDPIRLNYDEVGDPLGIRDALLEVPQLYDRARDPQERNNLWKTDPRRVEQMSADLIEHYLSSAKTHADMDDGQAPQVKDPHVDQMLAALGYFAANNADDARANADLLPLALRQPLRNPYEAPDTGMLIDADKIAQFTRRRLEQGLPLPDGAAHAFQELGNKYVTWAVKNPEYVARVRWRVEALTELATRAGVTLDMDKWRQRFMDLDSKSRNAKKNKAAEASHPESAPAPPPGPAPDVPGDKAKR